MTRGAALKDFCIRIILPVAMLLFCVFKFACTRATDYVWLWILCGLPFGIHQMFLWITPGGSFFSIAICSCKKLGIDHLANPHKDYLFIIDFSLRSLKTGIASNVPSNNAAYTFLSALSWYFSRGLMIDTP